MLVAKISRKKMWFKFAALLILLAASVAGSILWMNNLSSPDAKPSAVVAKKDPQPIGISSNVLFTGNIFWGRYMNDWAMASDLKLAYPFSRLNEFGRENYDAWISGLECPVANGVTMTSAEMEAQLQFNCSPEYLPEAAKWFTAVSLANNHTDNQGAVGFSETQANLDANGIQHFGHYDYANADDVCEVIALPVNVTFDAGLPSFGKIPVAMCGYHGVFGIPTEATVAEIAKYSPYMPVIAMPHMGAEYQSYSDEIRSNFYHSLIDNGADMVMGDHPHWVQNTESYNGHLIVYSMGNFMFDQQFGAEVTRSAAIRTVFNVSGADSVMLKKWLALGDTCATFKDSCLSTIQAQNLTKLNFAYQFGAVGTNDADHITKPATPEQQDSILQRLNWSNTMQQLQPPYSSL